jgi:uncharacterized membrane protein required for colicin V production
MLADRASEPVAAPDRALLPFGAVRARRGRSTVTRACVNIADSLSQVNVTDVLIVLYLFGFFILGFIQGTIRRLVGIASIVFSFFLALQLNDLWLGNFLATNWTQYPKEYSVMIGYLVLFIAGVVAFTLVIQGTYKKAPLFAKYPVIDEILGGVLGVVQGFLLLMFLLFILDQYYLYTNIPPDDDEFGFLRTLFTSLDGSNIGQFIQTVAIPALIAVFGFLIPAQAKVVFNH